jgi:hypothetical protein
MSIAGLARLWSTLGAFLALYAIGTLFIAQGGKSFAELPGLDGRAPVTSAYEGVIMIGFVLAIQCIVGILHIRGRRDQDALLPVAFISDLGPHEMLSLSMQVYQAVCFAIFVIVPAVVLCFLAHVVLNRGFLWYDADPALGSIRLRNAYPIVALHGDGDAAETACAPTLLNVPRPNAPKLPNDKSHYVWLTNLRCDPAKFKQLMPFKTNGVGLAADLASSSETCVKALAKAQATKTECESSVDISEFCEASVRNCRGIQWVPGWSMSAFVVSILSGTVMLVILLFEFRRRTPPFAGRSLRRPSQADLPLQ